MNLNIRYKKKRKISNALNERVREKMVFIIKHLEEDHPVHLVLSEEKDGEHAELSFHYQGHDIISKAIGQNLYEAIDNSIKHASRQLERYLDKTKHHKGDTSIRDLDQGLESNPE